MPVSCLDEMDQRVQAFDLTTDDWDALKVENRKRRHLRMSCCGSPVVLKKSRRGTQFFAHTKVGTCLTADEGEEHRVLKAMIVQVARACGWDAEAEVAGTTPDGEEWRADVLATKGNAKVAIEIQWSGQVDDETMRRQERYRQSGVRGLWLLRQPKFPVSRDLPAICIGGSLDEGFRALLPHWWSDRSLTNRREMRGWKSNLAMADFIRAAFAGRLKWGRVTDVAKTGIAKVVVAEADCEKCGVITDIIVGIGLAIAGETIEVSLRDITRFEGLIEQLRTQLPESFDQSHIKVRHSHTLKESYLSNGCLGCDRLYGDFFMLRYRDEATALCQFPISLTGDWSHLIEASDDWEDSQPEWWLLRE